MGFLEDQDYYCYHHCLIFPSFTPSPYPSHFISASSLPACPPPSLLLRRLPPCSPLYPGPQSEDRLLAGGCCRGGRASESLMRCLSPPSRLDRSSQQRITTTTTLHCTTHCTMSARLPTAAAAVAAAGIARGKVCVCVCGERGECVSRRSGMGRQLAWPRVCVGGVHWQSCIWCVGWRGGGECVLLVCVVHKHVRVTVCVTVSAISVIRVCEKLALGQTIL